MGRHTGDKAVVSNLQNALKAFLMKAGIAIIILVNAIPMVADTGAPQKISEERRAECKAALQRIGREALKGVEARFSSSDQQMMSVCGQATGAQAVRIMADSPENTRGIKPELLQTVKATADRLVGEFNQSGAAARFPAGDLSLLRKFLRASEAAECLTISQDSHRKANIKPEILTSCVEAAGRVISEFNDRGGDAQFRPADEEALKQMQEALHAKDQTSHL